MSTLDDWVAALSAELDLDVEVNIKQLLDVARDAAHGVDRPAAPLTTFLVAYAAAQQGGGAEAVTTAVQKATALAAGWAEAHPSDPL